jgi:hypothetical protein
VIVVNGTVKGPAIILNLGAANESIDDGFRGSRSFREIAAERCCQNWSHDHPGEIAADGRPQVSQ